MTTAWERIPGMVISNEVIAARAGWSRTLSRGQVLRLVDLEGKQAADFLCYNAADYDDRYAAADTMKINGNIFIRKGTVLYSVNCNALFTVTEDTCGRHDTIGGCCSSALNRKRYGKPEDPNCRANFLGQLARYGMGPRDMVANLNFFMYVPVGRDGAMDMGPSISKPGPAHRDGRAGGDVQLPADQQPGERLQADAAARHRLPALAR
jgi:uncharacterized protein